jgi:molecular chaperone Hsp33
VATSGENHPWTLGEVDQVQGFTIPARHARGRVVRLGPVLDAILSNHNYPPSVERVLSEALALTALLGSTLKDADGQLTLQAQTEGGAIDLLVCDYKAGEMRGYVRHDPDRLAELPVEPSLFALFGKGYLAITFDQAVSGERYQGIVPLEGGSIAEAAEAFFSQSEQIPSLVRIAVSGGGPQGRIAGGLMLQHLPEGEEGRERLHTRLDHPEWESVVALAQTVKAEELLDPDLGATTLLWRLFNEEEVRVMPAAVLARGCRCSPAHIRAVLMRFPEEERAEMLGDDGLIRVDCAFCARTIPVDPKAGALA